MGILGIVLSIKHNILLLSTSWEAYLAKEHPRSQWGPAQYSPEDLPSQSKSQIISRLYDELIGVFLLILGPIISFCGGLLSN